MKAVITKKILLYSSITLLVLGLSVISILLLLKTQQNSREISELQLNKAQLEQQVKELTIKLEESERNVADKDSQIAQLTESKQTLTKSVQTLEEANRIEKPQREVAEQALESLQEIEAATNVGSDIFNLNRLMIQGQAKVSKVSNTLPKGKLRTSLEAAMSNYSNAMAIHRSNITERDEELKFYNQQRIQSLLVEARANIKRASSLIKSSF